jgi:hypothetical protein
VRNFSGFIYVEKFDWNGNPIKKYKLDHWGYFCVDSNRNKIIMASMNTEQPFLEFDLGSL